MPAKFSSIDVWLALMVLIWGSNFAILKAALREVSPVAFNALRLALAAAVLLAITRVRERPRETSADESRGGRFSGADWRRLILLGVEGNFIYQLLFVYGLHLTSAANSALIFGATPVTVGLLSAALGHERVGVGRWAGVMLSLAGIYLAVRGEHEIAFRAGMVAGDVLIFLAMLCWAIYTVSARPLLARHSPLVVTAYSMAIGSVCLIGTAAPALVALPWRSISAGAWGALVYSALLSLAAAYVIWYTAVARIGNSRTAVYSNATPLAAMLIAWTGFGERITAMQLAGAAAILSGIALTKLGPAAPLPPNPPE